MRVLEIKFRFKPNLTFILFAGVTPILVGGTVFSIGLSFGTNCGYAINPARDFAPRLFSCK